MSVFIEQNSTYQTFDKNSWCILNPIEQSIKEKIESVGTPLKDWDININYGIKTGLNEAFIIDSSKKDELIAKDPKSAEIIRPILRGRDIQRYSYNFADKWLINTHNGSKTQKRIDINDYPAIKEHLDKYWEKLVKRDDQGDTPYNLRCCSYTDDFSKQKIIYPNMTKYLPFLYDEKGFMTNQKCFIITGNNIHYLTAFLNSSLFKYVYRDNFPELQGGTRELSKIFFEKISIKMVDDVKNNQFKELIINIQELKMKNQDTKNLEISIDNILFDIYNLTEEERETIGFIEIK